MAVVVKKKKKVAVVATKRRIRADRVCAAYQKCGLDIDSLAYVSRDAQSGKPVAVCALGALYIASSNDVTDSPTGCLGTKMGMWAAKVLPGNYRGGFCDGFFYTPKERTKFDSPQERVGYADGRVSAIAVKRLKRYKSVKGRTTYLAQLKASEDKRVGGSQK